MHKIFGIQLDIAFAWENYSSEFSSRVYDSSSHGLFFFGFTGPGMNYEFLTIQQALRAV